jgi:hypothetical protein
LDTSIIEKSLVGLRDFIIKVDVSNSEVESLRYEVEGKKLNIFLTPVNGSLSSRDVSFDYGDSDLDFDLAIVIGTGMRSKIDRIYTEHAKLFAEVPVANIDFRRSNEGFGAINLIEPTAASLCEIVVALSESLQAGMVDANIATVLLTGLMGSTDKFTAPHTSAKSLTIAAQMMAAGGDQQKVVRGLSAVAPREDRPAREERLHDDRAPREERPSREDRPRDDRAPHDERPTAASLPRGFKNEKRIEPLSEPIIGRPPANMLPEVFIEELESAFTPEPVVFTPEPATEPGTVVTAAEIESEKAPAEPIQMADFTAAAEILRRHHANIMPADAEDNERPAAH